MKRVYVHLADFQSAVGLYRTIFPCRYLHDELQEEGIQICMSSDLRMWEKYDAYHLSRLINPSFLPKMLELRRRAKIGWEEDDAMDIIPEWSPSKLPEDLMELITLGEMLSDAVVTTVEPLRQHIIKRAGPEKKVFLGPNLMDLRMWPEGPPQRDERQPVRILYTGSMTHEKDLEQIVEPVWRIAKRFGRRVQMMFWGYCHPEIMRRMHPDQLILIPPCTIHDYAVNLVRLRPDICLAPLDEHPFNSCKSAIKWQETSLAGAAVVASEVGPYKVIRHGIDGLLVSDPVEWETMIARLVENPQTRKELNEAAQARIREEFSWQGSMEGKEGWKAFFRELAS